MAGAAAKHVIKLFRCCSCSNVRPTTSCQWPNVRVLKRARRILRAATSHSTAASGNWKYLTRFQQHHAYASLTRFKQHHASQSQKIISRTQQPPHRLRSPAVGGGRAGIVVCGAGHLSSILKASFTAKYLHQLVMARLRGARTHYESNWHLGPSLLNLLDPKESRSGVSSGEIQLSLSKV